MCKLNAEGKLETLSDDKVEQKKTFEKLQIILLRVDIYTHSMMQLGIRKNIS